MTDIKFKPSYNNMCNQEHVMHYESGSSSCYFVVATIDNRVHYKLFISMCRRVMYIVYIKIIYLYVHFLETINSNQSFNSCHQFVQEFLHSYMTCCLLIEASQIVHFMCFRSGIKDNSTDVTTADHSSQTIAPILIGARIVGGRRTVALRLYHIR